MEPPTFFNFNVAMKVFQTSTQKELWVGMAGIIPRIGEQIVLKQTVSLSTQEKEILTTYTIKNIQYNLEISTVYVEVE